MKYRYSVGPVELLSDRRIDGLTVDHRQHTANWSVSFDDAFSASPHFQTAVQVWQDRNDALSVYATGERFVVRFEDLADFLIDPISRSINVFCSDQSSAETINHLLLDQVLPRVLAHEGRMVMHAAGVLIDNQVVTFLGETGHGKSTLASSFLKAGFGLLTDDALVMDTDAVVPTAQALYPTIRLWPSSVEGLYENAPPTAPMAHYSTKQRLVLDEEDHLTGEPRPMSAGFILKMGDDVDAPGICRLGQQEACIELIRNSFLLTPNDRVASVGLFERALTLTQSIPVYELTYPKGFDRLAETREVIVEQLEIQ